MWLSSHLNIFCWRLFWLQWSCQLCWNQLTTDTWFHFFTQLFHWPIWLFLCSNTPSWWLSLYNKFSNRKVLKFESLQLHFCFPKLFWLLWVPCSPILILKSALSICTMKPPGIPVEIALNLNINLGGTVNLKIETYDNEHGIFPFYLELLSFLSTIFCNSQSISFTFLLLNLYLNI